MNTPTLFDPVAEVARLFGTPPPRPTAQKASTGTPMPSARLTPQPAPKIAPAPAVVAKPELSEGDRKILQGMSKVKPATAKAEADGFRIETRDDLVARPPLRFAIKRILPDSGVVAIFGPSGSGKGFIEHEMLCCLADGTSFFGHAVTRPLPGLSIQLEGVGGIPSRVKAREIRHGKSPGVRYLMPAEFDLLNPEDRARLIRIAKDAGIVNGAVSIDTMNRAAPGIDENSSRDAGLVLAALKEIQAALGGIVIIVHHSGKDATRGMRGHSSFYAAMDAVIEVTREGDHRCWRLEKSKDGEDGLEVPFRLEVVEVGEDEGGEAITSCVVVPDEDAKTATRSRLPKGGNQRIAWDALGELLRGSKYFGMGGAPVSRPCIELETAVETIAPRLAVEDRRKTERTRQALTGLIASHLIEHRDGWIWLP